MIEIRQKGGAHARPDRPSRRAYRLAACLAVAGALFLVWANLAVGIIGNEENPLNLVYGAVIGTGAIGAALARFEAHGMARTMVAMAIVQIAVAIVVQVAGHFTWPLTLFYVALWLACASLFRKAARA